MTHHPEYTKKTYFIGSAFRAYSNGNTADDAYSRGLCIESAVPLDIIREHTIPSIRVTTFTFGEDTYGVDLYVGQYVNDEYCLLSVDGRRNIHVKNIGNAACATKADLTWDGYEPYVHAKNCITATDFLAVKESPSRFRRIASSNIPFSSREGAVEVLAFTRAADAVVLSEKWVTSLGQIRRFSTIFSRLDL